LERSGREPDPDMNQNREKGRIPKSNLDKKGKLGKATTPEKSIGKKDGNLNGDP